MQSLAITRCTGRQIDQPFEHLGFLGAGNGVLAVDQETGNAVYPEAMRVQIFGMHKIRAFHRIQKIFRGIRVHPLLRRQFCQQCMVPNIRAINEMRVENPVHQNIGSAESRGVADQPVRIHTVGRAAGSR